MLGLLLCWVALTVVGLAIGTLLLAQFDCVAPLECILDRIILAAWIGILVFGALLLLLALVAPLSTPASVTILALAGCGSVLIWRRHGIARLVKSSLASSAPAIAILVPIAAFTFAGPVDLYDTGLYHYQAVKWLSEVGVAPGLSFLHARLGHQSSWLALAAAYDNGVMEARVPAILGGYATLLVALHFVSLLSRIAAGGQRLSATFLAAGYATILPPAIWWEASNSLSPDWPVWILSLMCFWSILLASELKAGFWTPVLISLCAASIKLAALPLVFFAVLFYATRVQKPKSRVLCVGACALGLLPIMATQFIATGCPAFPSTWLCASAPQSEVAAAHQAAILEWGRWGGTAPEGSGALDWFLVWCRAPDKLALLALSLACALFLLLDKQSWKLAGVRWVFSTAVAGALLLFVTSPNPRFGLGFFAAFPALALAALLHRWGGSHSNGPSFSTGRSLRALAVALGAITLALGFARDRSYTEATDVNLNYGQRLVLPERLPGEPGSIALVRNRRSFKKQVLQFEKKTVNDVHYISPVSGDQCWAASIPCTPAAPPRGLRYRDSAVGNLSGFVVAAVGGSHSIVVLRGMGPM